MFLQIPGLSRSPLDTDEFLICGIQMTVLTFTSVLAVVDPDLELRGGPALVLLAQPEFLPSVISSFLPKIRGRAPLDPPLFG